MGLEVVVTSVLLGWLTLCWLLRRWRAQYLEATCQACLEKRREQRDPGKTEIANEPDVGSLGIDGVYGSAWRVHNLLMAGDLKFEAFLAMSARGLFLTYGIPSISSVLQKTGGFSEDTSRRYADMELLIREFCENAPDGCLHFDGQPDRAIKAIGRLNAIHDKYGSIILYRDMMYVLSVFMTTPFLLMESRWSWRRCTKAEKECIFFHWVDIGSLMGLRVEDNFSSLDDVVNYKYNYEKKHMRYAKSNEVVGHSTIDFFVNGTIWGKV